MIEIETKTAIPEKRTMIPNKYIRWWSPTTNQIQVKSQKSIKKNIKVYLTEENYYSMKLEKGCI